MKQININPYVYGKLVNYINNIIIPLLIIITIIIHCYIVHISFKIHIIILLILWVVNGSNTGFQTLLFLRELKKQYNTVDEFVKSQKNNGIEISKNMIKILELTFWKSYMSGYVFPTARYFMCTKACFSDTKLEFLQRQYIFFQLSNYENMVLIICVILLRIII